MSNSSFNMRKTISQLRLVFNSSLYRKASSALLLKIIGTLSGFLLYLLISRQYGAEGMGVYTLFTSLLGLLGIFCCLGLSSASIRLVPEILTSLHPGDLFKLRRIQWLLCVSLSLVSAFFLLLWADELSLALFDQAQDRHIIYLIAIILPAFSLYLIGNEFLRTLGKTNSFEYFRSTHIQFVGLICLLFASWYFSELSIINFAIGDISLPVYFIPIIITTVLYLIAFSVIWVLVSKELNLRSFPPARGSQVSVLKTLKISLPMLLTAFSALLMERVDSLMLGYFHSTEAVGQYGIAFKLASLIMFLVIPFNAVLVPKLSQSYWKQEYPKFAELIHSGRRFMFWGSLACFLFLIFFSEGLLALFGPQFIAAKFTLIVLCIGFFANAIHGMGEHLLNLSGNEKLLTKIFSLGLALNIILNLFLIPPYGIQGAAVASMLAMLSWNIIAGIILRRKMGISIIYFPYWNSSARSKAVRFKDAHADQS